MSILYHLTMLPPKLPRAEALSQEVDALRRKFGGCLYYLNPNRRAPIYVPRLLFGAHLLGKIRKRERFADAHHLYNPDPFPYPVLSLLRKPVIYSLSSRLEGNVPNLRYFASLDALTVYDSESFDFAGKCGLENCFLVRPGIDSSRLTHAPLKLERELRLLVGSAPWSKAQFRTKGVRSLLITAKKMQNLHLIFLWRGELYEEMVQLVNSMGLWERVTLINREIDVNEVLAGVHASATLAADSGIIKSYPHSLMESLVAGKPVIVNRKIPMSEYVASNECGIVVDDLESKHLCAAIDSLVANYDHLRKAAERVRGRDFTLEALLDSFEHVYQRVTGTV